MNDDVLSKIADRIDRAADRLRFTGKIAEAEACSQAASRIRAGMSIERAQAIEAFFIFGISSGVRTRLSALSGSGEYDGSSAVTSPQPQGANTLSLNSPDLPPAGQSGQASMGMETISQNMQYAAALSQDSYVDPYSGVQYPTDPLLTDPLKGGPSPYYPGGQSVNSYNAKSPAASPSGQTPDLYSAFQNFNAYGAPGTGFDSSLSPFFPSSGRGFDTSQMWASNGPTPGNSAGTLDTPGSVQKIPQGNVTRNGNSYAQFLVTINGLPQYYEYMNDFLGRDWTEPLQSSNAPQPTQPIPGAPAPSQGAAPPQPIPAPPTIDSSAVIPFYFPPAKGDLLPLTQYHDTGSTSLNYAVNWLYGYGNLAAALVNSQGEYFATVTPEFLSFVTDVGRAVEGGLRAIGFSDIDIQALKDSLLAGEASIETLPGALSYLGQGFSALYADERGALNLPMLLGTESTPGRILADFSVNNMSESAAAYQTRAGGLPPGMGYYVNRPGTSVPVQFDGYQSGELIDAKYYLENGYFVRGANAFIENPDSPFAQVWVSRLQGMLAETERQLAAAGNVPMVWRVASQEAAGLLQQIFGALGINIRVVYFP
jgi:hypothetical protein